MYYLTRQFCFCTERYVQTNLTIYYCFVMALGLGNTLGGLSELASKSFTSGFLLSFLAVTQMFIVLAFYWLHCSREEEYASRTESWTKVVQR